MSDASTADNDATFVNLSQDEISRIVNEMQLEDSEPDGNGSAASTDSSDVSQPQAHGSDTPDSDTGDSVATPISGAAAEEQRDTDENTAAGAENVDATGDAPPAAEPVEPVSGHTGSDRPTESARHRADHSADDNSEEPIEGVEEATETIASKPVELAFEESYDDPAGSDIQTGSDDERDGAGEIALREMIPGNGRRRYRRWLIGGIAGLMALGLAIGWGTDAFFSNNVGPMPPDTSPPPAAAPDDVTQPPGVQKSAAGGAAAGDSLKPVSKEAIDDPFRAKLADFVIQNRELREDLLIKKGEIEQLKRHYQKGIDQVEAEILAQKNRSGVKTLVQALKNKKIELGLKTIQRRNLYIQSLNQPADWLEFGSEELLYTQRRIEIEVIAASVSDQADIGRLIADGQTLNQGYMIDADKLTVELQNDQTLPVKSIWRDIVEKEKKVALSQLIPAKTNRSRQTASLSQANHNNHALWEEICNGNFSRKSEMTALSAAAARCLAYCNDTDMFLNRLSGLSPNTARHLFQWKGNWICLNGLKSLPPETAVYLFQWKGKWISLNGLETLTAAVTRHLRQWPGKRLELMGLDAGALAAAGPQVLHDLRQWQKSGGTLYMADKAQQLLQRVP